jgi:solute carrier family 25 phosphate transporter 3
MFRPELLNKKVAVASPLSFMAASPAEGGKSVYDFSVYTSSYFLTGALAGGVCCSVTHGGACPIDVVKTRMQLDPELGSKGMLGAGRAIVAAEGAGALAKGLGATAVGYFVQGWFKFGGFEFFKVSLAKKYGDQGAWDNRFMLNSMAAACAEFIADIFLCPLEATRIKQVSDPEMAKLSLPTAASTILKNDGLVTGFYSGFVPILFKQIPYTIAKFVVQDYAAEGIYQVVQPDRKVSGSTKFGISLLSGVIAGVVAAIISHPADTLLSKMNKGGAGGEGGMFTRMGRIAGEMGFFKLCTQGLAARCIMIGGITAGQFGIFDTMLPMLGVEKFHYHKPH